MDYRPVIAGGPLELRRGFDEFNFNVQRLIASFNAAPFVRLDTNSGLALNGFALSLDVNALVEDLTPDVATDCIPTHDGSGTKKVVVSNIVDFSAYTEKAVPAGGDGAALLDMDVVTGAWGARHKGAYLANLMDIAGQAELATSADVDINNDFLLVWDASATGTKLKKTKPVNMVPDLTVQMVANAAVSSNLLVGPLLSPSFIVSSAGNVSTLGALNAEYTGVNPSQNFQGGAVFDNLLVDANFSKSSGTLSIGTLVVGVGGITLTPPLPVAMGGFWKSGDAIPAVKTWMDLSTAQSIGGAKTFTSLVTLPGLTVTPLVHGNCAITIGTGCTMTSPPAIGGTGANAGRFTNVKVENTALFLSDTNIQIDYSIAGFANLSTEAGTPAYYCAGKGVLTGRQMTLSGWDVTKDIAMISASSISPYSASKVSAALKPLRDASNILILILEAHGLIEKAA